MLSVKLSENMDFIADFMISKILDFMKFGFSQLFFELEDQRLAVAFGLKQDIFLRMIHCSLLRSDGRAISADKMQTFFKGQIFVEMRRHGNRKQRFYRFFDNCNEKYVNNSPLDAQQPQLWKSFLTLVRNLGDTNCR